MGPDASFHLYKTWPGCSFISAIKLIDMIEISIISRQYYQHDRVDKKAPGICGGASEYCTVDM